MMNIFTNKKSISFSPELHVEDELLNYWLNQVTVRLRREILWYWHERVGSAKNFQEKTLPPFVDKTEASLNLTRFWENKKEFFRKDQTAKFLSKQLESEPPTLNSPTFGSFGWLAHTLKLDNASMFVLALGLIPHFDHASGSVIASCNNDSSKTYPTFALAQKLWGNPKEIIHLTDFDHKLFQYGIFQLSQFHNNEYSETNLEMSIAISTAVANHLLFPNNFHSALKQINIKQNSSDETIDIITKRLGGHNTLQIVPILGKIDSDEKELIAKFTAVMDNETVEFIGEPKLLKNTRYFNSILTYCWLNKLNLFLNKHLVSIICNEKNNIDTQYLPLQSIPIIIFIGITDKNQISTISQNTLLPIIEIPELTYFQRIECWKQGLGKLAEVIDESIKECSRVFRFEKQSIDRICQGLTKQEKLSRDELFLACRTELEMNLGELAQKVKPRFKDEKLILPPKQDLQFTEIENAVKSLSYVHYNLGTATAWNEGGLVVLFTGNSGTGKTMAAEILAEKCDLPMYRIDLAGMVSKYVGETPKNLKKICDSAEKCDTILFFDEADSLFSRRTEVKDAHDRYANIETNYLLQRLESFKGLAILATNREKDIDQAFLRRIRYKIEFPTPGEKE
ncbi:MAG: ATP-binding protein [Nitrosopumilus sp.]|nr:ATP-binding protein [Nitrosopumilus sp.]